MKKTNKDLIFERMGLSSPKFEMKIPVKETNKEIYDMANANAIVQKEDTNYPEQAGSAKGIIEVLVSNIEETIKYINEIYINLPKEKHDPTCIQKQITDLGNIKKRLFLNLERARKFIGQ